VVRHQLHLFRFLGGGGHGFADVGKPAHTLDSSAVLRALAKQDFAGSAGICRRYPEAVEMGCED
jgi:hypothetical protein